MNKNYINSNETKEKETIPNIPVSMTFEDDSYLFWILQSFAA